MSSLPPELGQIGSATHCIRKRPQSEVSWAKIYLGLVVDNICRDNPFAVVAGTLFQGIIAPNSGRLTLTWAAGAQKLLT